MKPLRAALRRVRPCLATLSLLTVAPGAIAEPWTCNFTVECVVSGACSASAFEVEIIAADHEGQLFLRTAAGDEPVTRLTAPGALPASYASAGRNGLAELLTVEANMTGLMSIHIFEGTAQAVTYFGSCGALE